jgi:hypothetical protein
MVYDNLDGEGLSWSMHLDDEGLLVHEASGLIRKRKENVLDLARFSTQV